MKAKTFVLTFRDHLLAGRLLPGSTVGSPADHRSASSSFNFDRSFLLSSDFDTPKNSTTILSSDSRPEIDDLWVLKCINVARVQPIVEALDEDGSGFISVKEANKFAAERMEACQSICFFAWLFFAVLIETDFNSFLRWIAYWAMGQTFPVISQI